MVAKGTRHPQGHGAEALTGNGATGRHSSSSCGPTPSHLAFVAARHVAASRIEEVQFRLVPVAPLARMFETRDVCSYWLKAISLFVLDIQVRQPWSSVSEWA